MMTEPRHDADHLPDDNRLALRQVARACRKASLASLLAGGGGAPYASLVTVAFDHDLSPILLLSQMSDHTRNVMADARVSLLLDGTEGHSNPQTGPRVTLMGRAERSDDPRLAARFLARHPGAARYAGFADFAIWRVALKRAHFVGGFGRAVWFDAPFGLPPNDLIEQEAALISQLNTTHAQELGADRRIAALDTDGIDIATQQDSYRLAFAAPAGDAHAARARTAALLRPSGS